MTAETVARDRRKLARCVAKNNEESAKIVAIIAARVIIGLAEGMALITMASKRG